MLKDAKSKKCKKVTPPSEKKKMKSHSTPEGPLILEQIEYTSLGNARVRRLR